MTRLHEIRQSFASTVRRFPLPSACSALFAILSCVSVWNPPESFGGFTKIAVYLYILFLGCFWFITLQLLKENSGNPRQSHYLSGIGLFVAVAAYLYTQVYVTSFTNIFLCLCVVLLMFVAPYLRKNADALLIWTFAYRLVLRIAFTFLAAIILYLGVAAILASLDYLLGIKFSESGQIYFYTWIIVAAFFSPLFAMAGIPKSFTDSEDPYPRFLRILVCNLMIPLWFVYAIVVYAYIVKILFTWKLPDGGVAILVSLFAVKGVVLYLAGYPLYQRKETVAFWLGRHGAKLLIAPLILLAVAIFTRIREDGVTDDRYAIVLCLAWLAITVILWLRAGEKNPLHIMICATILLFVASFGPWGVDSLPVQSQVGRLRHVLEENHMLSEGRLVPPEKPVSFKERAEISSIIDYLTEKNRLREIKPWFSAKYQNDIDKPEPVATEGIYESPPQRIAEDMGIQYVSRWQKEEGEQSSTISYNEAWDKQAIPVSGYDYAVETSNYTEMCSPAGHTITLEPGGNKPPMVFSVNFHPVTGGFELINNATQQKLVFDISSLIRKSEWFKRKTGNLILDGENNEIKARVFIKSVYGRFNGDRPVFTSLASVLLVKIK